MNFIPANFLTARWEYLAMFNYEVDPAVLQKHLPPFTEIDYFNGRALVSVVGFLFNQTRVLGIQWPGLTDFEEVNLRFYIRYFDGSAWRRGVGFISEIVPYASIAYTANLFYNEHYSRAEMKHQLIKRNDELELAYYWKQKKEPWYSMELRAGGQLQEIASGSEEEFIFEHYFGYNRLNRHTTIEYSLYHPRWELYPVKAFSLTCNIGKQYGEDMVPFIEKQLPHSVFLARGSEVEVRFPRRIRKGFA